MTDDTTNNPQKFVPGVYMVGDIKTFSKRPDVQDLKEGVHTLEDGAKVAVFRVPEHTDDVLLDQDGNTFAVDSGYVGVIRADYLSTDVLNEYENQQDNEDALPQFSIEVITAPFTPQCIDDPLHEGDTVIVLGDTFLSTNAPELDDVDEDGEYEGNQHYDSEYDENDEDAVDDGYIPDDEYDDDDEEEDYEEGDDDLDR